MPIAPWTDYMVTNRLSGKTYRVALRGLEPGESYCSCPDFRTNTLGTCKHVLHVSTKVQAPLHRRGNCAAAIAATRWPCTCAMPAK